MSTVALKLKILPSSLDINLDEVQAQALTVMESLGSQNTSFVQDPIAFGLKALIITTAWPEVTSVDEAENKLAEISGVSSVEVLDYRRAFG